MCLYVSVCLFFACPVAFLKNHTSKFHQIFVRVTYDVHARSSSVGSATGRQCDRPMFCTSCSHRLERMDRIRNDTYVSSNSPVWGTSRTSDAVTMLLLVKIARWRHRGEVSRLRLYLVLKVSYEMLFPVSEKLQNELSARAVTRNHGCSK